jgi:hypothetical protein
MADQRISWAAGFIDADGHIGLVKAGANCKPSTRRPMLMVTQISLLPLEVLQDLFGGKIRERPLTSGGRRAWVWDIVGERLVEVLPQLIPFLILKRREAQLAYEYAQTMGQRGKILTTEQIFQREEIIVKFDLAKAARY